MRGSRWGTGGPDPPPPPPPENHKNIDQASIQRWAIIGTPAKRHLKAFRWRADDGPLFVLFGSSPRRKKKRCQSSDPDQIRMEFGKECFVNAIESMQSTNTVEYPTLSCKSRCAREAFSAPIHDIFRDSKRFACKR